MVDLWNDEGTRPVNLVRHSNAAPTVSISSSTTTSYPPAPDRPVYTGMSSGLGITGYAHPVPSQTLTASYVNGSGSQNFYPPTPSTPNFAPQYGVSNGYAPNPMPVMPAQILTNVTPINQNHTRNLIGSNSVNAQRLNDLEGKPGFWFVLQDLSVRTEGHFRYVSIVHIHHALAYILVQAQVQHRRCRHRPRKLLRHQHGQMPYTRVLFLGSFHGLFGQEIPRCHREHSTQQVLRCTGHQDPYKEGRT